MTGPNKINRRHFVCLAALGTGSICLLPRCTGSLPGWRFFSGSDGLLIDAISEQIIPTDEWPGGRESGVTNFIDKQLAGPYVRFRSKYRKGIDAVQQTCLSLYNKKFEEMNWDDQTAFLESLDSGLRQEPEWAEGFGREFFSMVRDHSMQAYYGSPIHGGNKNKLSYKMIRLDYPLIIGQNRYKI